jgi:replicative DNA helicase
MSMLRESGQIEADADTITFLWPDNTAKPEGEENAGQYNSIKLVDFHILKNRDGEQRKFTLSFDGELSKFTAPKKDK